MVVFFKFFFDSVQLGLAERRARLVSCRHLILGSHPSLSGILSEEPFLWTYTTAQVGRDLKRSSGSTFCGKGNPDVII